MDILQAIACALWEPGADDDSRYSEVRVRVRVRVGVRVRVMVRVRVRVSVRVRVKAMACITVSWIVENCYP
jgi:hypothetical protein